MVKQGPGFSSPSLIHHPLDRLIAFQHFLKLVRCRDGLKRIDRELVFTGVEERQKPVVATDLPIYQTCRQRTAASAQGMDHQGQGDLIQPWIEGLRAKLVRGGITDFQGKFQKLVPEFMRTPVKEKTRVKVQIALPVFIRLTPIQTAFEIQPEFVVKRFP